MRLAIQSQNRRRMATPGSAALKVATKRASSRISSTPNVGTSESTVTSAMAVARNPASPKPRMRSLEEVRSPSKRKARRGVGEDAGRSDDEDRVAEGGPLVLARHQLIARREGELHAVGKADHHDERRHHVEEHVEAKSQPPERAEREDDRKQRRAGGDQHQRQAAEEEPRDRASEREADGVVKDAVALEGVADFELHDRHAGQLGREAGPLQVLVRGPADVVHDRLELAAVDGGGLERKDDDREPAVVREQLAADDLVALHLVDECMVGAPLRQGIGKEGLRHSALRGGLARGEHRESAARAVDQLHVGDEVAQLLDRLAGEQRLAAHHDQDVVFARREIARNLLELFERRILRPEQLAQRVVGLDALDSQDGQNGDRERGENRRRRRLERNERQALDSERDAARTARRLGGQGIGIEDLQERAP